MTPLTTASSVLLVAASGLALGACGVASQPGYYRTVQENVRQTAFTRAPSGPAASGPMLAAGRWGVEGSVARDATGEPTTDATNDQWTIHTRVAGRVSVAPREGTELGLSFEGASATWSAPTASPSLVARPTDDAPYLAAGVQLRQVIARAGSFQLGIVGEVEVARAGFVRAIEATTRASHASGFSLDGGVSVALPPPRTTTEGPALDHALALPSRTGIFASGAVGGLRFDGGLLAQLVPFAPAHASGSERSYCGPDVPGGDVAARGCLEAAQPAPSRDANPFRYGVVGTAFAGVSYTLGRVSPFAQFHVNLPDANGLSDASRWGVASGLRVSL